MPRIAYLTDAQVGPPDLVASTRKRRGGALINLDRILLYSEPVAAGWGAMLGRLRQELTLRPLLREMAMCAVAALNGAEYEMVHHAPLFLAEGGSQAQLQGLRGLPGSIEGAALFNATERAVLRLTVAMTFDVKVSNAVFADALNHVGNDRIMLELITVIAAYNMVSRVLVAVDIQADGEA